MMMREERGRAREELTWTLIRGILRNEKEFQAGLDGGYPVIMAALDESLVPSSLLMSKEQSSSPLQVFFKDARNVFKLDELGLEIAEIAFPAALALTADPVASLVDTAFIGQIDTEKGENHSSFSSDNVTTVAKLESERKHIPSVSSALVIGGVLGLLQALFLISGAIPILAFMGVKSDSPMLTPARQYLTLRSLGAPAVLLSLAMQGVFRGLKDTKTPLYATVAGDATNIILDPIFMFVFHLGVSGAAIAHVISQYLIALILLWRLLRQVDVLPPTIKDLQLGRFLKNGFLLLMRVVAVTFCVTLAASMAARQGSIPMAAFQICLQVWLATSLLADGLAVAGQAILASAFARKEHHRATAAASRVLQWGMVLGLVLCAVLGIGLQFASRLFTKDVDVLHLIHIGIPFVALTQPINALAFVFDGINFGASDFAYSAYSMVLVAIISIICLVILSSSHGFIGLWVALSIYMSLRMLAGFWRIGTARGPWTFLRNQF
ncbi:uncharacterized protein A4U43_C08F10050 [Asparagus officinalis]|nr:uncharacterized protein A4U43_C08F10050 [Asparagus officinalis]